MESLHCGDFIESEAGEFFQLESISLCFGQKAIAKIRGFDGKRKMTPVTYMMNQVIAMSGFRKVSMFEILAALAKVPYDREANEEKEERHHIRYLLDVAQDAGLVTAISQHFMIPTGDARSVIEGLQGPCKNNFGVDNWVEWDMQQFLSECSKNPKTSLFAKAVS